MSLTDFYIHIIVTIIFNISKINHHNSMNHDDLQQGKKASNPRPTVLETAALPAELFPFIYFKSLMVDRQGLEPRTDRL